MANSSGVAARIIHISPAAKNAVAPAVSAKSRFAHAFRRHHQTSACTIASVRQAAAIIDQRTVTQLIGAAVLRAGEQGALHRHPRRMRR